MGFASNIERKKSGFRPIRLNCGKSSHDPELSSDWDYLWIGDETTCYGVVPDKDVKRLRDRCTQILRNRKKAAP